MHKISPQHVWIGHAGDLADVRQLHAIGIRTVVDLALNEEPPRLPRDLPYCRLPIVDGTGNDPWMLLTVIDLVAGLIKVDVPLLVCCSAGSSRSPVIVAAGLSIVTHETPEQCLKTVSRTVAHDVNPGLWHDVVEICRSRQLRPLIS
jgi:protein-tyrosine phosphatase